MVRGMKPIQTPSYKAPSPRVLQVLPALSDGGVEQSAVEMACYIKRQGWASFVASAGGRREADLERAGIPHIRLPLAAKAPWTVLFNAWRLRGVIRREGISLVHARSRAPAWSSWLACRWAGVPFVTTFHGTYGLKGGFLKRIYNSVMTRGPVVIANSAFIRDHIIENYDVSPSRIVVAARGVEVEMFNPALFGKDTRKVLRQEWKVPEGVPVVMLVGRLTRWKGQDLLLRALAFLPKKEKWVAVLVGGPEKDGAFAYELERLAGELGIAGQVRFLGSRKDIPRLLMGADLAVSASVKPEAFGRVAVEAMAMGVPVAATALGGSMETVMEGETGWLVRPNDRGVIEPQAVSETIGRALRNPEALARMGKKARAHVLAHFTAEQCCAAEMVAYRRVLGLTETKQ